MSNGPARSKLIDKSMQECGEKIADPFEISTIRREDYENHKGKSDYEDLLQANTKPSVAGARGHQGPAAFLLMASGLDQVRCLICIYFSLYFSRLNRFIFCDLKAWYRLKTTVAFYTCRYCRLVWQISRPTVGHSTAFICFEIYNTQTMNKMFTY
jgi:hypothetical protein